MTCGILRRKPQRRFAMRNQQPRPRAPLVYCVALAISLGSFFQAAASRQNLRAAEDTRPAPPALNGAVNFVDITRQAGITFRHISSPVKRFIVESMSGGVAVFDYDNDGWLDIYFVNSL